MRTLDVLVPSYRVDPGPLLSILKLDEPPGVRVRWTIVVDDPKKAIPHEIARRTDGDRVRLIQHQRNLGSAAARNTALDQSDAAWVLFLDDDVHPLPGLLGVYARAVKRDADAVGFFGPTEFEPARSIYQRGVEVSDILTFFFIARRPGTLRWAPTSNVLVRGDLARAERFRTCFPRGGGGEDIDYLLRVSDRAHGAFHALPEAGVLHPWWHGGRRDYRRFLRWSYGDSLLHDLHPEHTYRSLPNAVECLVVLSPLMLVASIILATPVPLLVTGGGIVLGEVLVEFLRILRLKGLGDARFCLETLLIRSSNDLGRLLMQAKRAKASALMQRWDHFCNGEHVAYHRRWAFLKCLGYTLAAAFLWLTLDAWR